MANMKNIKSKIKSVSNIQQITKALEIVATVKLQKIKKQTEHYRDFMIEFLKISQTVNTKTSIFNQNSHKNGNKELIIVVGTDKGLCGSLNNKLFKKVFIEYENKKKHTAVFCIGKKTLEFFSRSNFNVVGSTNIKDNFVEEDLMGIYTYIKGSLSNKEYRSIKIYFNYFQNAISQIPINIKLFPLKKKEFENIKNELNIDIDDLVTEDIIQKDMFLEPTSTELAKEIKKQLLQHIIYGAILQNKTGEFSSRMIAMKNAKDNSLSLIKNLKLTFNKARQSTITQEISEIVGAKMAIEN